MRCPFRITMKFDYIEIPTKKKDEEPLYLEKAQRQEFGDCYGNDCPFYSYSGSCERVRDED